MKLHEVQVEDVPEMGVVEVYLMTVHGVCSDQIPFRYHDATSRRQARTAARKRGQGLADQHGCKCSWNF